MLVLDEPTNDLDMETLELLQEVIADYQGTIIIISHDRDFVDRTVTALLVFEDDGRIIPMPADILIILTAASARRNANRRERPAAWQGENRKPRAKLLSFKDKHALETLPGEIA